MNTTNVTTTPPEKPGGLPETIADRVLLCLENGAKHNEWKAAAMSLADIALGITQPMPAPGAAAGMDRKGMV